MAAVTLLGTVVIAGAAGGFGNDDSGSGAPSTSSPGGGVTAAALVTAAPTTAPIVKTALTETIGEGSSGEDVSKVQQRLKELGFDAGPIDGQFGGLTRAAVWAFEKLVMQIPRDDATGRVTNDMWQLMQDPLVIQPRRPDASTPNHTEVYLPEQVVIFFVGDKPALVTHMASGNDEEWCEEVTISPGEIGNEDGTEPLKKGECGRSNTPGGVFEYYRRVEGVRESALGGMWNPVYFNYGIAIHGALNVPLQPASHGCIRIPLKLSEYFQTLLTDGDQVFVFDGVKEPEEYGAQLPTFNWRDPDYTTTTTATTTTVPPTTQAPATLPPATQPPPTEPPPATTAAPPPAETTTTIPVP